MKIFHHSSVSQILRSLSAAINNFIKIINLLSLFVLVSYNLHTNHLKMTFNLHHAASQAAVSQAVISQAISQSQTVKAESTALPELQNLQDSKNLQELTNLDLTDKNFHI